MALKKNLPVLAALLSLCACTTPTVVEQWPDPFLRLGGFYDYGAGQRDLQLIVMGDPFPMPPDAFARVVEADVQERASPRQPTYPKLHPGASARRNYALVFSFGSSVDAQIPDDLCQMRPPPAPAPPPTGQQELKVLGAFCVSGRAYTAAQGRVTLSSPDDPAFRSLMRQMMAALFRPDTPDSPIGGGSL